MTMRAKNRCRKSRDLKSLVVNGVHWRRRKSPKRWMIPWAALPFHFHIKVCVIWWSEDRTVSGGIDLLCSLSNSTNVHAKTDVGECRYQTWGRHMISRSTITTKSAGTVENLTIMLPESSIDFRFRSTPLSTKLPLRVLVLSYCVLCLSQLFTA